MQSSSAAVQGSAEAAGQTSALDDADLDAKKARWTQEQRRLAERADVPQWELYGFADTPVKDDGSTGGVSAFTHTRFSLRGLAEALDSLGDGVGSSPSWSALRQQLAWDVAQQAQLNDDGAHAAAAVAPPALTCIGGVDISFIPNTNDGIACLAILRYPSLEVVQTYMHRCTLQEPYISTYLAFREIQPVLELFQSVQATLMATQTMPQLLVVDGNGVHHPRRCGLATHLGVVLDIPTIGCSKTILQVDGITREGVEAAFIKEIDAAAAAPPEPAPAKRAVKLPSVLPVVGTSKPHVLYGYAVHGHNNSVKKCIFVSPGHGVGFAVATALVVTMLRHRIPEPIRAADLGSRAFIRELMASQNIDV